MAATALGTQWQLDNEPDGVATQSIVPQFFGNDDHPDSLTAIREWTAGLYDSFDAQDDMIARRALRHLTVPVSIVFGDQDRYLNPSLASEIHGLFSKASLHLVPEPGHYPQHDQPQAVAGLIKHAINTQLEERTS